jgi:hypothetical protein
MNAMLRSRRLSAVVFLTLCGAPLCAEAQQFVCWPIVRGDTASGLARRLAGTAAATYTESFQINDPQRHVFVPKSQYSRLSTDWQACVARELVKDRPAGRLATPLAPAPPPLPAPPYDFDFAVRFGAGVSLMLLMISLVRGYGSGSSIPPPPALQRVGEEFLTAFGTPLVDPTSAVPPIAGRLRFIRRTKQLEICIAPNGGRRYPNLSDHKTNVVYDVQRVIRNMGAQRIRCDRLHAEGRWVVVSIRVAEPRQAGAK